MRYYYPMLLAAALLAGNAVFSQSAPPVKGPAEAEIARLKATLAANPADAQARESLGLQYEAQGRIPDAIEQYRILRAAAPDDPEYMYRLGRAYLSAAQLYSARLQAKAPHSARLPQLIAEKRASDGDPTRALEAYRQALRLDPRLPGVHLALARILAEQGDTKSAREEANRELALDPDSADARAFRDGLDYPTAAP